jgi:hypothetical protein
MKRGLLAFSVALLVAGVAIADIPPPKGQKRVTVDHKITTDKDIADYAFFTVIGRDQVTAVKFDAKTPIVIKGAGRGGVARLGLLVAIPKDAAKKYATEAELHKAIAEGKVEGLVRASNSFDSFTVVKDTDARDVIVREYTFDKIDAKAGIVLKAVAAPKSSPKDSPEDSDSPPAYTPRGGVWIAAVACFASLMFGGFWLAGRSRRKV